MLGCFAQKETPTGVKCTALRQEKCIPNKCSFRKSIKQFDEDRVKANDLLRKLTKDHQECIKFKYGIKF